jgi:putative acetyltransferase
MVIRSERPGDWEAVRAINLTAFDTAAEANLVDDLRKTADPLVSLVAIEESEIVGHILFSPVSLAGAPELRLMGLAPMAVAPARQRQGIGAALVSAGLERCRVLGIDAVVVLGHPDYYPRFGFTEAVTRGLASEYDVPPEYFLIQELNEGCLSDRAGTIAYHPAFGRA